MNIQRLVTRVFCALVLLVACAHPAAAQGGWPTVVMFHGGALKQPVFAAGADTPPFAVFVSGPRPAGTQTAKDMGNRPFVNVAFFWGPRDNPANNGTPLAQLKPEMTWQHGRFYPASGDKPAMLFMTSVLNKNTTIPFMVPGGSRMTAIPADPASFSVGYEVPAATLTVMQRLGVQTEAGR
jgi:hypothetical protein